MAVTVHVYELIKAIVSYLEQAVVSYTQPHLQATSAYSMVARHCAILLSD